MDLQVAYDHLTDDERAELDDLIGSMPPPVGSFREYVDDVRPGYQWYRQCEVLADVLQRVADGQLQRVMVFMPPRHGKSELVSRLFSGYYLRRYPSRWVGLTSYSAELSYSLSRNARQFYRGQVGLADDASAVKQWETGHGGGLWAAGVGGSITGKGAHLGLIDDPIKNAEEALSATIAARNEDWYDSTFYTRLEPGAALVVVQTRWPPRDLSSYLLDKGGDWHVVDFSALKSDPEPESFYPDYCTIEPDWRAIGEALCPERYNEAALTNIRATVGEFYWSALYQQRPRPREGGMFKRAYFTIHDVAPNWADGRTVRYWDRAATADDGDYTAGVRMQETKSGDIWITDVIRGQWSPGERDQTIKLTAETDRKHVAQVVEQEPGASGKDSAEAFQVMLKGWNTAAIRSTGEKVTRADPVASWAEVRGIKLVRGDWNAAFIDELAAFDKGLHDDQVDGVSGAFNYLTGGPSRPLVGVPFADAAPSVWG